jgi:hypothetical protein
MTRKNGKIDVCVKNGAASGVGLKARENASGKLWAEALHEICSNNEKNGEERASRPSLSR